MSCGPDDRTCECIRSRTRAHLTVGYAPWSPKTEQEAALKRALYGLDGERARLEAEQALAELAAEVDR